MRNKKLFLWILILAIAGVILVSGCVQQEQKGVDSSKTTSTGELSLREAYNLAKPAAQAKVAGAEIFNGITMNLSSSGKANYWIISFCSPSALKSVAVALLNGKVESVSEPQEIILEEDEFCEPLQPNWVDSTVLAPKINCAPAIFHWAFHVKEPTELPEVTPGVGLPPDESGGDTWELVCNEKFWAFDVYTGELVKSGEITETIELPSVR